MSGLLVVRELVSRDLPGLLSLYGDLHAEDAEVDAARAREVWGEILADRKQIYLGGFVDEQLIAACNASIAPNLTRGCRPFAVIENVVTAATHRRRGYGAVVMRELIERCWARNCYKVMLMSAAARNAAHEFYEALGFDRTSKQAFVIKR